MLNRYFIFKSNSNSSFVTLKSSFKSDLDDYISCNTQTTGKFPVKELHEKKEGYLYFSTTKKAEKPINLVLKLRFLLRCGVAKELC